MLLDKHSKESVKDTGATVYELITTQKPKAQNSHEYHKATLDALREEDERIHELITKEYERQRDTLQLIAAENQCSQAVLAALGSVVQNKTTEGFVGGRFHGGCQVVDEVEKLAVDRAKQTFDAQYANVQPHSGTSANHIVLTALLQKGDKILSLGLDQGGHLSHGATVSFTGKFFEVHNYYVDRESFLLDYEEIRNKALQIKPKLIICGATAYSRTIDFEKFREIAEGVGAYLLADVSHISGLIIAGAHPSPVDYAHFTTTSTYKPGGPRGGLIVMGKDYDREIKVGTKSVPLWECIERTTFPGVQGTPYLNNIAAKAVFFKETLSEEYRDRQFRIVENAKALANALLGLGFDVVTGGTDSHMVLVNVANFRAGLTGIIAQKCLEDCGIVVNMNRLPYDTRSAAVTSGIRVGTPIVTRNGMGPEEMKLIADLIHSVLSNVVATSQTEYSIDQSLRDETRSKVRALCTAFPMH